MRRIIYFILLLPFFVHAQIMVDSTNLPNIGDTVIMSDDFGNFSAGSSGANQSWDFSALTGSPSMLLGFIDPQTTPYSSIFPSSNISVQLNVSSYFYLNRSYDGIAMVGVVDSGMPFPWQQVMLPTPLNYLDTLTYTNVLSQFDTVLFPPVPSIFLDIPGPYLVDSVSVTFGSMDQFVVDAWGQVQMPNATHDALRIFQSTYEAEIYNVRVTDTANGQSQWIQLPPELYWGESRYSWRTNDSLVNWSLVEMDTDSAGNPYGDVTYYLGNSINSIVISPPIVDIDKIVDVSCSGGCDGMILLDIVGTAFPFTYSWSSNNGFTSNNDNIFNLCKGTYYLSVIDANGNIALDTFDIYEPSVLSGSITANLPDLYANASGGKPPYSYLWDTGDTLQTISISSNGVYTCTITDKNGCDTTLTITVSNIPSDISEIDSKRSVVKILDILGREAVEKNNRTLFYIYDDGTVERRIYLDK